MSDSIEIPDFSALTLAEARQWDRDHPGLRKRAGGAATPVIRNPRPRDAQGNLIQPEPITTDELHRRLTAAKQKLADLRGTGTVEEHDAIDRVNRLAREVTRRQRLAEHHDRLERQARESAEWRLQNRYANATPGDLQRQIDELQNQIANERQTPRSKTK